MGCSIPCCVPVRVVVIGMPYYLIPCYGRMEKKGRGSCAMSSPSLCHTDRLAVVVLSAPYHVLFIHNSLFPPNYLLHNQSSSMDTIGICASVIIVQIAFPSTYLSNPISPSIPLPFYLLESLSQAIPIILLQFHSQYILVL